MSSVVGEAEVLIVPNSKGFAGELGKQLDAAATQVSGKAGKLNENWQTRAVESYNKTVIGAYKSELIYLQQIIDKYKTLRSARGTTPQQLSALRKDISAVESRAVQFGATSVATGEKGAPGANAASEVKNLVAQLEEQDVATKKVASSTEVLASSSAKVNKENEHSTRSVRALARSYGVAGIAVTAAFQATRELAQSLQVTGDAAGTASGRLSNAASNLLTGNFIGAIKAARVEATLFSDALANLQAEVDRGDFSNLTKLAAGAKALGDSKLADQLKAIQLQSALSFQSAPFRNTATGAVGSTPAGSRPDDRGGLQGVGAAGQINTDALIGASAERRAANLANAALRAELTKGLQDDLRTSKAQVKAAQARVDNAAAGSEDEKKALSDLVSANSKLGSIEGQILSAKKQANEKRQQHLQDQIALDQIGLQIELANARSTDQQISAIQHAASFSRKLADDKRLDAQARAGYALDAAQADKQIFDINAATAAEAKRAAEERARQAEQDRKEAMRKLEQKRQEAKQLKELTIENRISAAGLTKSTADDKKAINIQIAYFRNLVKNTRGLEREQARSQLISARSRLQGLNGNTAPGATAGSFFDEAASQFRTYGSNISGSRNGVLSGQDARARFAQISLANRGSIGTTISGGLQSVSAAVNAAATEAVIHTQLLKGILNAVAGSRIQSGLKAVQAGVIQNARKHALNNGGGI